MTLSTISCLISSDSCRYSTKCASLRSMHFLRLLRAAGSSPCERWYLSSRRKTLESRYSMGVWMIVCLTFSSLLGTSSAMLLASSQSTYSRMVRMVSSTFPPYLSTQVLIVERNRACECALQVSARLMSALRSLKARGANCPWGRSLAASSRASSVSLQSWEGSALCSLGSRSLENSDDLELLFLIIQLIITSCLKIEHYHYSSSSQSLQPVFRSEVPSKSVSLATTQKEKAKLVKTQSRMKPAILACALERELSILWRKGMDPKYSGSVQQQSMTGLISELKSSTCWLSVSLPKMQSRPIAIQASDEMMMPSLQMMVCQDFQQMLTISTLKMPTQAKFVRQYSAITTQSCQQITKSGVRLYSQSVEQTLVKLTMCRAAQATSVASMQIMMLSTITNNLNRFQRVTNWQLQTVNVTVMNAYSPITTQKQVKSSSLPRFQILRFCLLMPLASQKGWTKKRSRLMKGMAVVLITMTQNHMMLPVTLVIADQSSSSSASSLAAGLAKSGTVLV